MKIQCVITSAFVNENTDNYRLLCKQSKLYNVSKQYTQRV